MAQIRNQNREGRDAGGSRIAERGLPGLWRTGAWLATFGVLVILPGATAADVLTEAAAGHAAELRQALQETPKAFGAVDENGNTALILAAKSGSAETLQVLLDAKAQVNTPNRGNETPLWTAVNSKHGELAKTLVAAGARVDCMASKGTTPLHEAIQSGDGALAEWLVEKGANVNYLTRQVLLGDNGDIQGVESQSPLQLAIAADQPELVDFLLAHHADTEIRFLRLSREGQDAGSTALHRAALKGNLKVITALVKAGANLNTTNNQGMTPLHLAVEGGFPEAVDFLLESKAESDVADLRGRKAIDMIDAEKSGPAIEAIFAKRGIKTNSGRSVIMNLRALATAQAMFIRKNDFYSASAAQLGKGKVLNAKLAAAFESFQKNGDAEKPVPLNGYIYRMLQGDEARALTSYYRVEGDPAHGMNTWACVARSVDGKGFQYYITEAGTVYGKEDTGKGKFMLDWTPPQSQVEWPTAK